MIHNVCSMTERIARVVVGLALLSLWFVLPGNAAYLAFLGLVPIATAAVGYCPLSQLLGFNTCTMKETHA
jgi:hypothetical protein